MTSSSAIPDELGRDVQGLMSLQYAHCFTEFGDIVRLPASGICLLRRPITPQEFDLAGLYPYSMCRDWFKLRADMDFLLETGAVSVVLVADPFCSDRVASALADWDLCLPFKTHYVVDLTRDWRQDRSKETRRLTRRALEQQVSRTTSPQELDADELWALYQNTIKRHNVTGVQRLLPGVLYKLLKIDDLVLTVAEDDIGIAGAMLTVRHGDTAYAYLEFLSSRAHDKLTSYALIYTMLEELEQQGCKRVNLGGAAGLTNNSEDGLASFKQRQTNMTLTALICGTVLQPKVYSELCRQTGTSNSVYFPAYRQVVGD